MPTTILHTAKDVDINAQILSTLDKLNAVHAKKRTNCFAKGLPFYTCIDSVQDLWTRELGNGQTFLIKRDFDFEKDAPVDSLVRELR